MKEVQAYPHSSSGLQSDAALHINESYIEIYPLTAGRPRRGPGYLGAQGHVLAVSKWCNAASIDIWI